MHTDRPMGRGPPSGSFLSQWLSNGSAYLRVPIPHTWIRREVDPSLLILGMWLGSHLSLLVLLFLGYRGLRLLAPTVLPPIISPPMVPPPPRSFLPVGIGRWCPSDVSTPWSGPSQHPRPVTCEASRSACMRSCSIFDSAMSSCNPLIISRT